MLAFVYPFGRGWRGRGKIILPECFIVCSGLTECPSRVEHRACFIRFEGEGGEGGGGRESGRACTRSLTVVNEEARDDRRNKGLRISEDVSYIVGKEL